MSNQIKVTIDVSDELLAKLLHAFQKPSGMGIPMQALLGMASPPLPKETPKDKPTIGFKS